jgi:FtsX-like permease family
MALPAIIGTADLAGFRAAIARPIARTLGQRLGLDLALIVVAAIAFWQLRRYGAPISRNVRGTLGIDPLLVAAPAIGLIAGGLVATRLLPRIAEIAAPVLDRSRGAVGSLGGRAVSRRPLRYTRSALLLMLAAALGTFSVAYVATWSRSQTEQAAYRAGADVRVVGTHREGVDATTLHRAYGALPGVSATMAVDRASVDSGRSVRNAPLLALDAAAAPGVLTSTSAGTAASVPSAGLAALAAGRPAGGTPVGADAHWLSFIVDPRLDAPFTPDPEFQIDLASDPGLSIAAVLVDQAGTLHRAVSTAGFLSGLGQRLEIELPPGSPLVLRALEVDLAPNGPFGVTGRIEIRGVEISASLTPVAWKSLPGFPAPGGSWTWPGDGSQRNVYQPRAGHPLELRYSDRDEDLALPPAFGFGGSLTVTLAWQPEDDALPAVVGSRFLELTSTAAGDEVAAVLGGSPSRIRIVTAVDEFPTLDPAQPFVIVDGPTLAAARYFATGAVADPGEWWIATSQPDEVAAGVATGPDPSATIITRRGLERSLVGDPIQVGVIGLLGLGSIAALVFAAIGFVVSAVISTGERAGELALLRALGLSAGEVARWLSSENAFLLAFGTLAGMGLGALLAWLVLPFSAMTSTGDPPVPPAVVLVPLDRLIPIVVVPIIVLAVTAIAVRRQLAAIRIGDVLRARAE